ncbi:MAG: beta-lactamase family protein [Verrucomicrobia bacterium]|nr:beta-lactamase family protein [Verrucomicrobiota bacterium]
MKYLLIFLAATFTCESSPMQIDHVENSLMEALAIEGTPIAKKNIYDAMKQHSVPAVSIAVINNGTIEWARSYGTLQAHGEGKAETSSLFQAGSVSKPVAAIGVLALVQKGLLDLDQPVDEKLVSWKPQNNDVTLRHLLSHTSGYNVIGFDGYKEQAPLPTLQQILNGEQPANNPPVLVQFTPGSKFAYSGGGYCVMQLLVEEVTGKPFHHFMDEVVFKKLALTRSTFCYPLPKEYVETAAVAHPGDGKPMAGRWKTYPESAAAGLWTTPSDLATLLLRIEEVLDKKMVAAMMKPAIPPYGLGPVVNNEGTDDVEISHKGRTDGFASGYVYFPHLKKGAVVMLNADNGSILLDQIFRSISHVYNWPTYKVETKKVASVAVSALSRHAGRYGTEHEPNDIYDIQVYLDGSDLLVAIGKTQPLKLHPESENRFFNLETGRSIIFGEEKGTPTLTVVIQSGFQRTFRKF